MRFIHTRRFQKRHYRAIAEMLQAVRTNMLPTAHPETAILWEAIIDKLVTGFEADSGRFDSNRFREWCDK